MHVQAYEYVDKFRHDEKIEAIEFGSRNINGTIQVIFPNAQWTGIDIAEGEGVDVVADASTYTHPNLVDLVVCCEVFEHTPSWREIIANAYRNLKPGGMAIFTCAGRNRNGHSAVDGLALRPGEYYANVFEDQMEQAMKDVGFKKVKVDWLPDPGDTRAVGYK